MPQNITVYASDETLYDLKYIRFETDAGPTQIFARAVQREARRIRRQRDREQMVIQAPAETSSDGRKKGRLT